MSDYVDINGRVVDVEVLGQAKTVRLRGKFKGEVFEAPMEVWIMSLIAVLDDSQKENLFKLIRNVESTVSYQRIQRARVVAEINMPDLI